MSNQSALSSTPVVPSGAPMPALPPAPPVSAPQQTSGQADSRSAPVIPARQSKDPRKVGRATLAPHTVGLPPALTLVSNLVFYTNQNYTTSGYISSFLAAYHMLYEMDLRMLTTYRFMQSSPGWHPLISQLYICILYFIHVLRCQREAAMLDIAGLSFLREFETTFDLLNISVPGPHVPFFQAMNYCSGPFERLGDVSPGLNSGVLPTQRESYLFGFATHLYLLCLLLPT